jgi:signal transduction histidine kinase
LLFSGKVESTGGPAGKFWANDETARCWVPNWPISKLSGNLDPTADMTLEQRSALERRARATQRLAAIGEMTGGIVHDFRNLLAVIESGLRLAENSFEQPEKVRTYLAPARKGIDRGVNLTSQLLAFAKLQQLETRAEDVK